MTTDKNQVRVGLACFVWRDGKFLIQQRYGSHGEGTWSIPGGHLEMDESWEECAAREVMEETGMKITNIRFLAATNDIFQDHDKHYVTIWVESDWLEGEPTITEPDKCKAQDWATFSTLPEPLFEPCWQNLRQVRPELFTTTPAA
jgi:8-oxo-dGTP diphosphatase